jgi:enoyl-CoA hydratase
MSGPVVLTERRNDSVLVITLNRPRVRNAVTREVSLAVAAALDELDGDADLRVGVITGAGGYFSSGMDLRALSEGESAWLDDRGFAGIVSRGPDKPLIAAIEGFAVAGGFEIVLACDLVVAARDAYLSIPEVKRCLVPIGGGITRLAERLPENIARELVLTGDPITAGRAAEWGLVNRLAAPGEALEVACALAAEVAGNAPLATLASARIFKERRQWAAGDALARQQAIAAAAFASDDAREGSVAFLEKRMPVWRGV